MTRSSLLPCSAHALLRPLARFLVCASLVLVLPLLLLACGDDGPPAEDTLSTLADEVGDAKLDETDFASLLARFTVPEYAADSETDLARYQLYLLGKAAALSFTDPEPSEELVVVRKEQESDSARVQLDFRRKEGLLQVADISKFDVELVKTENADLPWRIRRITLGR